MDEYFDSNDFDDDQVEDTCDVSEFRQKYETQHAYFDERDSYGNY